MCIYIIVYFCDSHKGPFGSTNERGGKGDIAIKYMFGSNNGREEILVKYVFGSQGRDFKTKLLFYPSNLKTISWFLNKLFAS